MIIKISVKPFKGFPKRTACAECGEPQVFKWDSAGDGKNIILTSSHNHEGKVQRNQIKEVA